METTVKLEILLSKELSQALYIGEELHWPKLSSKE